MSPEPTPLQLGGLAVTLVPHHIDHIGSRVFLVLDTANGHTIANLTLDDVQLLASRLKLAALEAEALAHKAQRRRA